MNHANYEQRLEFVQEIVQQRYSLTAAAIKPIDYDPYCQFPYNNFVYCVDLVRPFDNDETLMNYISQPGVVSIPSGTTRLVMRLSNAAAGLNDRNRVENEVAAMTLV